MSKPGYFADRAIAHFKPCIVDGDIDAGIAIKQFGLNERQIPLLRAELIAVGLIKEERAEDAPPVATIAPLELPLSESSDDTN